MELTKQAIDAITFEGKNKKYYFAKEVDELLDQIAEAADLQCIELARLYSVEQEYNLKKGEITEVLLMARNMADSVTKDARRQSEAELEALNDKKNKLERDIYAIEQYREGMLNKVRQDLAKLIETPPEANADNDYKRPANEVLDF